MVCKENPCRREVFDVQKDFYRTESLQNGYNDFCIMSATIKLREFTQKKPMCSKG